MQRSDFLIRLISFIVFIAIAIYIGYYIIDAQINPLKTALAVSYTVEDTVETRGYAIRNEQLLDSGSAAVIIAEEGAHLSAKDPYAVEYGSSAAMARAEQIRELDLKIAQIDARLSGESSASAAAAVLSLSHAVSSQNMAEMDTAALAVRSYIFQSSDVSSESLQTQRESLAAQRNQLAAEAGADTTAILPPQAGTFSAVVDGFEGVTPNSVLKMTPSALSTAFQSGSAETAVGKLVTGVNWYYAATLHAEDAARLTVGKTARLRFTQTYGRTLTMTVESVGPEEDGSCVVTFSSNKFLAEIAALRAMSAEVIFTAYSGLRVPKEALRLDDDGTYLFILTGLQAHRIYVNILGELGDYYIVESVSEGQLSEGVSVIVKANGLYDGKVVQ